jgi:hypothetical protein
MRDDSRKKVSDRKVEDVKRPQRTEKPPQVILAIPGDGNEIDGCSSEKKKEVALWIDCVHELPS